MKGRDSEEVDRTESEEKDEGWGINTETEQRFSILKVTLILRLLLTLLELVVRILWS